MRSFDVALLEKAPSVSMLIDVDVDGRPVYFHTGDGQLKWNGTTYEGLNCYMNPEHFDANWLALTISDLPFGMVASIPPRMMEHSFIRFSLAVLNPDREITRCPDVVLTGNVERFKPLSNSEVFMLIRCQGANELPVHADSVDHTGHQTCDITTVDSPKVERLCFTCGVVYADGPLPDLPTPIDREKEKIDERLLRNNGLIG